MKLSELPKSVKQFVQQCGGVIIGSAAEPGAELEKVAAVDVLIPWSKWQRAAAIVTHYEVVLNSYGGMRFAEPVEAGFLVTVDVWPEDLARFIAEATISSCGGHSTTDTGAVWQVLRLQKRPCRLILMTRATIYQKSRCVSVGWGWSINVR